MPTQAEIEAAAQALRKSVEGSRADDGSSLWRALATIALEAAERVPIPDNRPEFRQHFILSARAENILDKLAPTTIEELRAKIPDLKKIKNCGEITAKEIEQAISDYDDDWRWTENGFEQRRGNADAS